MAGSPRSPRRTRSQSSTSSVSAVPPELDVFTGFCTGVLLLESREPLELEGFQRAMLADYFAGVRETLILLPKKSGKSTLLGALALFHLLSNQDAECVIGAASRDQATILYDQAAGFVRRSERLQERIVVRRGYRELRGVDGGRIRVLAADADTADGVIPTLALVDELHRHKSADLYGVFRDGLGPRRGRMITISTAGDDEVSVLGKMRAKTHELPKQEHDGAHRYATDGHAFALHEWSLSPDQDRDDIELVKTANPASWQTVELLRERRESPSMTDWQWARFACGVWVRGEQSAISESEWAACGDPDVEVPDGAQGVHVGVDLGWKWDTTALVPVWRPDGDDVVRVGEPAILVPPRDGTSLPAEAIWEVVEEMTARWPQVVFVLDPQAGGEQLAQRIDSEFDVVIATHSQKPGPMSLAAQRLSEAISSQKLSHPDDPDLTQHVLAAGARSVGEGWKFVKQSREGRPIDACVALAMAHSVLVAEAAQPRYARAAW